MGTHTDNRHYGTFIIDSTLDIENINNVDGVNAESLLAWVPKSHDLSDQLDGTNRTFNLVPSIQVGTRAWVSVLLDGQEITDFTIPDTLDALVLSDVIPPPQNTQQLIVYYIASTQLSNS